MYYVYVLQSKKDKKLYMGYTDNLQKRFKQHNDGKALHQESFEALFISNGINKK